MMIYHYHHDDFFLVCLIPTLDKLTGLSLLVVVVVGGDGHAGGGTPWRKIYDFLEILVEINKGFTWVGIKKPFLNQNQCCRPDFTPQMKHIGSYAHVFPNRADSFFFVRIDVSVV